MVRASVKCPWLPAPLLHGKRGPRDKLPFFIRAVIHKAEFAQIRGMWVHIRRSRRSIDGSLCDPQMSRIAGGHGEKKAHATERIRQREEF